MLEERQETNGNVEEHASKWEEYERWLVSGGYRRDKEIRCLAGRGVGLGERTSSVLTEASG